MGRYKLRTPFFTFARDQIRAGLWFKVRTVLCCVMRTVVRRHSVTLAVKPC